MEIECILKREGGTVAEVGGTEYHFKPNELGRHVAEVTNNRHIQRFLEISEGYLIYDPDEDPAQELEQAQPEPERQGESTSHEETEVLSPEDFEEDEESEGEEAEEEASGDLEHDGADNEGGESEEEYRERMMAEHEKLFGKRPHAKTKTENIAQKVADAKREGAE